MERTTWCTWLWVLTGVLWAKAFLVASLRLQGVELPWELELLREPVAVALITALTVTLVVWHLLAPMGLVWKLAYRAGRQSAEANNAAAADLGKVLPLQRQPHRN